MDNSNPAPIAAAPAPAKNGKGAVIGMVICSILALAGVGFGVYEMMNKPTQDLKIQVKDTSGEITTIETDKIEKTDGGKTVTITDSIATSNSIVKDTDEVTYSLPLASWGVSSIGVQRGDYDTADFQIGIRNGSIDDGYCRVSLLNSVDSNVRSSNRDCKINGFSGKISKAVLAVSGHDAGESNTRIVFLMEDGTVQYVTTTELIDSEEVTVKKLDIDGFVVDIVYANVMEKDAVVGGYATTLFVLSNGSTINFMNFIR